MLVVNMTPQSTNKDQILPGTLNLMILKTLDSLGSLHGFGITRRIEQMRC